VSNNEFEVFVHAQGAKPKLVMASPAEPLKEVLARAGISLGGTEPMLVFVGECLEALQESIAVDNGEDGHSPVDPSFSVEQLRLREHKHIHCHRCRHVAVEVNYSSRTKHHRFSPATTIAVVTKWALKKFDLTDAAAADYVLQICHSKQVPRPNEHLGELVHAPDCRVCFDLVKEVTPQG
jgi:hypothetical protein